MGKKSAFGAISGQTLARAWPLIDTMPDRRDTRLQATHKWLNAVAQVIGYESDFVDEWFEDSFNIYANAVGEDDSLPNAISLALEDEPIDRCSGKDLRTRLTLFGLDTDCYGSSHTLTKGLNKLIGLEHRYGFRIERSTDRYWTISKIEE